MMYDRKDCRPHFPSFERLYAKELKEKLCYVALDFEKELDACISNPSSFEKTYALYKDDVFLSSFL